MREQISLLHKNFLLIILLVWLIVPYFAYSGAMRILALGATVILTIRYFSSIDKKIFWGIVSFIVITAMVNTYASDNSYLIRHLQLYIFLIMIYVSSIVLGFSTKNKEFIIKIILILNLVALAGTFIGLLANSSAARILAKSSLEGVDLTESGVGGYGTVYTNILIFPLVLLVKNIFDKSKLIKILCWATIVAIVLVTLKANFFIAVLLLILQIVFLNFKSFHPIIKVISILVLALFLLSFKNNISIIIESIYPYVEGTSIQRKFDDILSQINGGEGDNDTIDGRTDRYVRSIKLFIQSPIIGVLSFNNVGKHAVLLDVLAQFGIILGGLLIFILKKIPLLIRRSLGVQAAVYISCFIITLFILGSINNYGLAMGTAFILLACIYGMNDSRISNSLNQLND